MVIKIPAKKKKRKHHRAHQSSGRCLRCKRVGSVDLHHITYDGKSSKTKMLCIECHEDITDLNTRVVVLRGYVKLTNVERQYVFGWWMNRKVTSKRPTKQELRFLINGMCCV